MRRFLAGFDAKNPYQLSMTRECDHAKGAPYDAFLSVECATEREALECVSAFAERVAGGRYCCFRVRPQADHVHDFERNRDFWRGYVRFSVWRFAGSWFDAKPGVESYVLDISGTELAKRLQPDGTPKEGRAKGRKKTDRIEPIDWAAPNGTEEVRVRWSVQQRYVPAWRDPRGVFVDPKGLKLADPLDWFFAERRGTHARDCDCIDCDRDEAWTRLHKASCLCTDCRQERHELRRVLAKPHCDAHAIHKPTCTSCHPGPLHPRGVYGRPATDEENARINANREAARLSNKLTGASDLTEAALEEALRQITAPVAPGWLRPRGNPHPVGCLCVGCHPGALTSMRHPHHDGCGCSLCCPEAWEEVDTGAAWQPGEGTRKPEHHPPGCNCDDCIPF